MGFSVVRFN